MFRSLYMDAMDSDMNSLTQNNSVEGTENQESKPNINNLLETREVRNEVENMGSNALAAVLQILEKHNLKVGE